MARVPRFVRPTADGMWETYVRTNRSGPWQLAGIFDCERLAMAAYKQHRRMWSKHRETRAQVERLLALAASFPVRFEVEGSLVRSSMDTTLESWQDAMLDRGPKGL